MQGLQVSAFKSDGVTAVRSEKTGIYYICILVVSYECPDLTEKETLKNTVKVKEKPSQQPKRRSL